MRAMRSSTHLFSLFALIAALWLPALTFAEDASTGAELAPASRVPETLQSPRATMTTFLGAMNDIKRGQPERLRAALTTLDLGEVNPLVRAERGRDLAWTLLEVMDRTRIVATERVPDRQQGKPYVFETYPQGRVVIAPLEDGRWLFTAETLAALPGILDGLAGKVRLVGEEGGAHLPLHLRLRGSLAPGLKQRGFILENWQWLGILVVIAVGVVADKLAAVFLRAGMRRWKRRRGAEAYQEVSGDMLRPLALMAMAGIWWAGLNMLGLPEDALLLLLVAVKFLAGISGVWAAYRLVDLIGAYLLGRAQLTASRLDDALVPLVTKVLKVFVTVLGVVFVADNLNIDVTSLLAGLGLGGLAFALAAKDVAGNLFGSITVLIDGTFHVGDWVVIGDMEGTVESIGFRSTRIRTFYNSQVTVPNSQLITASVDNMGKRRYRRLKAVLSLAYDTPPERIEAFCEGVRELVRLHPYMRKDYYHVYFNNFGASSLDVLVYVFWETPEWGTELRERHRFLLDCLRLAERLGVEFAYPTQTLYLKRGDASPPAPPEGGFSPATVAEEALALGREEAKAIVQATTGLNRVPPPVEY